LHNACPLARTISGAGDILKVQQQSSGVQLAYRDSGSGRPIVLVHGWGVSGALFAPQVDGLAGTYRVIVPDLPGHGASSPFPEDCSFSCLADCLAELISELKPGPVTLVGWSMGAMVSWDLLRRYRQLDIAGLATVDMVPRLLNGPDWSYGLREGEDHHVFDRHLKLMRSDWPAFTDMFMSRIFSGDDGEAKAGLLARAKKVALENDPESMARIWTEMVEQDFNKELPRLDLPALVISGRHSRLYSTPATQWAAGCMPQAKSVEFSRSGHAPSLEEPDEFNRVLSAFVDSIQTSNRAQSVQKPVETGSKSS